MSAKLLIYVQSSLSGSVEVVRDMDVEDVENAGVMHPRLVLLYVVECH
jgi:hypothetical protein